MALFQPSRGNASGTGATPSTGGRASGYEAVRGASAADARQQPFDAGPSADIRQSAALLARDQAAFIRQFHRGVKSMIPDSAVHPAFDLPGFCDRMAQALLWAALADQPPWVLTDTLRQLGAHNWYEGFPDSQYGCVAHALIQTVHYFSAGTWSASTGSAWISFLTWVQPHLMAGAREAAAHEAAAQRAAAEQEAARVAALSQGHTQVVNNVNIERVASLLDDDDDDAPGPGQMMLGMTRDPRRDLPRHQG
jgi:hypothetical protein